MIRASIGVCADWGGRGAGPFVCIDVAPKARGLWGDGSPRARDLRLVSHREAHQPQAKGPSGEHHRGRNPLGAEAGAPRRLRPSDWPGREEAVAWS